MTTVDATPINARAGLYLKRLREAKQMTQRDVERETEARFGPAGRVFSQRVSLIEKGQIEKPYIEDLFHIGAVLGVAEPQILQLYGWYTPPADAFERLDPRLREAIDLARSLPPDLAEGMLQLIGLAAAGAVAHARKRMGAAEVERRLGE